VRRSEALIDSLLALARSEAGAVSKEDPVDLADIARSAGREIAAPARERGIAVSLEVEPVEVRGDPRLLEQLVHNLAENAVVHNHDGGFARIDLGGDDRGAVIRVENSGPRIPIDAAATLAEPFQRLAGRSGAGVGLSIVRAVARAHGGEVEIAARPTGGLTVEVWLPATTESGRDASGRDSLGAAADRPTNGRAARL
jgi:signal transduction histidine kinase